jgi:predicted lipoprotein with Yx(FWY)xxD motif
MSRANRTSGQIGPSAARGKRLAVAAGLFGTAAASSVAIAAGVSPVVEKASNSALNETIAVDVHGRTLYALHPETTHHLLCKSHACLEAWPPLTVRSEKIKLAAGHGIEGHLGLLHRPNHVLQVTLRGLPLYRFAGDSRKGEATGDGIMSFGGTWHAVKATARPSTTTTTPTTGTPAPPPAPAPPYGY